jgi:CRP-like cAMP-binding protein/tetratricopeptide (TPR) repeat protein
VIAGNVRWERPTARSFWNALADPEREALAAAGVEEVFRPGSVLCREGDDSSQVMIIDSGWVKVSVRDPSGSEKILAVRGQGDVVGERAALTTQVRSATVTALDEVSAMVMPAERFAEFLRGHPRAVDVLQRQVAERREEDRARLFPSERAGAERRLAWLLYDLAQRRGGFQHTSAAMFMLPMSQQELADWAGTTLDAVGRFLRLWRERGIVVRTGQSRRLTVVDLDGLAAICDAAPASLQVQADRTATRSPAAENGQAESHAPGKTQGQAPGHAPGKTQGQTPSPAQDQTQGSTVAGQLSARWLGRPGEPLNCSILYTDVAGFGNPQRNDADRDAVRAALYEILAASLEASGVPWADCYHEDRGDGVLVVVPPTISTLRVVDPLIPLLAARLRQYNRRASEVVLIQLRAVLHVGPVGKDAEGLTGQALIGAARILETPVLKDRLAADQADLIFAVSDYVYDHVVRHCAGQVDFAAFEHVEAQVKESRVSAWFCLAGRIQTPASPVSGLEGAVSAGNGRGAESQGFGRGAESQGFGQGAEPEGFGRGAESQGFGQGAEPEGFGQGAEPQGFGQEADLGGNGQGAGPGGYGNAAEPGGFGHAAGPGGWRGPTPVAPPLGKLPVTVRGRDALLGEFRRALRPYPWRASRTFVIAGMGGLGKSTVALAAARMARDRGYRVWWVGATDTALLTSGMREVLRELHAPESVVAPVREGARTASARAWEFLNGEHAGGRRWLLIFDGADNAAVLAGADSATPADGTGWLPADPAGMVIVTTRNRDPQVWGTAVTLRELKPLTDEASAEVLRDLAPEVADPEGREARELSRRLGGLPLALHLAGAYLGSTFARWSTFADYHEALDSVELPAALADIEGPGADIRDNVQRTWDLSLDALEAEGRPQARPLLLVLSCFAPATPIPAWLLRLRPLANLLLHQAGRPAAGEGGDDAEAGWRVLREGLQGLSHIGLIEISNGSGPAGVNAVTVHPVVADANRSRLATIAASERTGVQSAAVAQLEAAAAGLDPTRPGDWPAWRLLVPHLNSVIDLLADDLDPAVLARLLTVSAAGTEALLSGGRLAAAEKLAQASVEAAAFFSRDDPAAMTARGCLADTLVRRGRSGEAEVLYRELLADRCRVQGDDHLDTLATRHDLAAAIGMQGRYGEAEELYRGLIGDDYRLLGPEHRETLAAQANLARMIGLQGRYAEAEDLGAQVLADQRKVLGDKDPDSLITRQNIARVTGKAGRYGEAEQLYREVLADRREVLGHDHPDTLSTRHRLARMIGLQGRYAEAEEQCQQILQDRHRLLGEDHPDNLATRHRLARMLGLQGRYADAEPMFRQVLAARRRTLGDDHPDTLATSHRLGWLIGRQGRYGEATEIVSRVLGGRRQVLGDDHPDTLAARETLAWLAGLRGKLGEADELCQGVLADRRRVLGDDHPDTLTTRATQAWLTELKGNYPEAERRYRDLLADRERVLGPSHPDTLIARHSLAKMIGRQHRYAEAEQLCREVLDDRHRVLGDDHPDTLTSRDTLAWLAAAQGRRAEGEELYRQVLADRSRVLGPHHPDTQATSGELARIAAGRGTGG